MTTIAATALFLILSVHVSRALEQRRRDRANGRPIKTMASAFLPGRRFTALLIRFDRTVIQPASTFLILIIAAVIMAIALDPGAHRVFPFILLTLVGGGAIVVGIAMTGGNRTSQYWYVPWVVGLFAWGAVAAVAVPELIALGAAFIAVGATGMWLMKWIARPSVAQRVSRFLSRWAPKTTPRSNGVASFCLVLISVAPVAAILFVLRTLHREATRAKPLADPFVIMCVMREDHLFEVVQAPIGDKLSDDAFAPPRPQTELGDVEVRVSADSDELGEVPLKLTIEILNAGEQELNLQASTKRVWSRGRLCQFSPQMEAQVIPSRGTLNFAQVLQRSDFNLQHQRTISLDVLVLFVGGEWLGQRLEFKVTP